MFSEQVTSYRNAWAFQYSASEVADGARKQRDFRLSRVEWWTAQKNKLMQEVKESGIEVTESVAASGSIANYSTRTIGPQVSVRADLQQKLTECHSKIQYHQQQAAEYDGWVQFLVAQGGQTLELTQGDWLYFFGKV